MVLAAIQFTQGATTDLAGRALLGVTGTTVTVASADTSPLIASYLWTLVEAPDGSALPVSPVDPETLLPTPGGPGDFGATSAASFLPDLRGCYVVDLELTDVVGQKTRDRRVFGVLETTGRLLPPFLGNNQNMNFGGQTEGWKPYQHEYNRAVDQHDTDIDDLQTADGILDNRLDTLEAKPQGHVIQNNGSPLTQRNILNLIGFTVQDDGTGFKTNVTASPGVATVANYAGLTGLAADVQHAYVTSRKGHFLKFGGVWGRLDIADPASLTQATWFIDSVNGNDDNDGLTSGTAIATWAEYMARIGGTGRRIVLPQTTTITILKDLPEVMRGDVIVEDGGTAGAANRFFVLGTVQSTLLASTTITSVQQVDTATGVERQITVTGLDFTPYVGKRARRTSDNAIFWISAAVSLGVAAVSADPGIIDPLNWNITPTAATLAAGNTFVIEELPQIRGFNMNFGRGSTSQTGANFAISIFDSLWFSGGAEYSKMMEGQGANTSARNVFSRCKINTMRSMAFNGHAQLSFFEARNTSNNTLSTIQIVGPNKALLFTNCHFNGGVLFAGDVAPSILGGNAIRGAVGAGLTVQAGATATVSGTLGIYNSATNGVALSAFGRLSASAIIHGSGNGSAGINAAAGAVMSYSSSAKPTIKGSTPGTNDVNIGGTNYDYATNVPKFDTAKACGIVLV